MVWFVGWFCILIWMLQLETLFKRTVHPDTLLLNFSPWFPWLSIRAVQ
jgi:hypothetical protein